MVIPKALGEEPSWPTFPGVPRLVDASLQPLPPALHDVLGVCLLPHFTLRASLVAQ